VAKLVVTAGDPGWREFKLEGESVIGRDESCDVLIRQPWISRRHARIIPARGRYFLEDLKTPNGTNLNGRKITRAELHDGDRITLGNCELAFTLGEEAAPAAPPQIDEISATVISTLDPKKAILAESNVSDSVMIQRMKSQLQTLQDVAETACGAFEIDTLVSRILDQLLRVFPQASHAHAVLLGLSEAGRDVHLSASQSGQVGPDAQISSTLLEIATRDRKAVLASDAMSDSRFASSTSIVGQSLRAIMCSPLVAGDKVLGALQIDTTSLAHPFTVDDLQLLATVTGQAAVAAESARLHRELAAKQRLAAVGETISSLAHCIKNVLNGLKGGAYVLEIGINKQDADKTSKGWEMVKRNTDFVLDLVKDMLAYCKREALVREPTSIVELLDETILMVQESAAQRGIETSLEVDGDVPEAQVDPTAMKRAVLNLLTNAVEACEDGCRVTVSARAEESENRLVITVQDTGPGIPPELTKRLFEPFFTTKGSHGTGLGLPLVKKVVEDHGGRVELESEPGQGTAFRMLIPLRAGEPETSLMK